MKTIIAIIFLGTIFVFLFYNLSGSDWFFVIASIVTCFLVGKIIERYKKRKLTPIQSTIICIIICVPILSNIIPIVDLLIMSVGSLIGSAFYDYNTVNATDDKKA